MEIVINQNRWNSILSDFGKGDIFFNYEYFDLFRTHYNTDFEGIYFEDQNLRIFWTHIIRDLTKIPLFQDSNYCDLATPYGFGGPLIEIITENEDHFKESLNLFFRDYIAYARKKHYVSEFIRFHPLINFVELKEICNMVYMYDIVALDLTQSYEDIWKNMTKHNRYYLKKAINEFDEIFVTKKPSEDEITNFLNIYKQTMDKNQASAKYYFSKDFIASHFAKDFDNLLIYCKKAGKMASTGIFLVGKENMHYHLSATDYSFQNSPSRSVLWKAIQWGKENGLKWFNFGGGFSPNDNLSQFKKEFSRTTFPFYRGEIVFDHEILAQLSLKNPKSQENISFFPKYRIGIDSSIV